MKTNCVNKTTRLINHSFELVIIYSCFHLYPLMFIFLTLFLSFLFFLFFCTSSYLIKITEPFHRVVTLRQYYYKSNIKDTNFCTKITSSNTRSNGGNIRENYGNTRGRLCQLKLNDMGYHVICHMGFGA